MVSWKDRIVELEGWLSRMLEFLFWDEFSEGLAQLVKVAYYWCTKLEIGKVWPKQNWTREDEMECRRILRGRRQASTLCRSQVLYSCCRDTARPESIRSRTSC